MLLNNLMVVKWKWHYDISFYIAAKNALGCEKLFNHYTMLYTTHHNMLIRNAEKLGQNHWIKNKKKIKITQKQEQRETRMQYMLLLLRYWTEMLNYINWNVISIRDQKNVSNRICIQV